MEFALSADQKMLQESIAGTLSSVSDLDSVRKVAAGDVDAAAISTAIAELGTAQLLVPEDQGGLGLSALDAVLVQESLGAHVSPAVFMANSALGVTAIAAAASASQRDEWLARISSGDVRLGVAVNEQVSMREGAGVVADDNKLSGKALFALEVDGATHILVSDSAGALHIAPLGAGISSTALTTIDRTRRFIELTFDGVESELLTGENEPGAAAQRTVALARILLAADTLGASQAMLDKAVEYAKERKQFGRIIGSFQAVKHMCAEMAAKLEPCRSLVWYAAYLFDEEPERAALMACHAKAHMSEVGTFVARTATEVYGGMGFTDLVGLHYWFKRIGVNRQLFGGPEILRAEAARLQGF
ncbi:MAG: acyl-CoA dehydrogenase family protein [Pseudomonadota bacterium]